MRSSPALRHFQGFSRKRYGPTDRRTDRPTDRQTDARTHLKINIYRHNGFDVDQIVRVDCRNFSRYFFIRSFLVFFGNFEFAQSDVHLFLMNNPCFFKNAFPIFHLIRQNVDRDLHNHDETRLIIVHYAIFSDL